MKLECSNSLGNTKSWSAGYAAPLLCLLEPINLEIILHDEDSHILGSDVQVRFKGEIQLDKYETVVSHGMADFKARRTHTEKLLSVDQHVLLGASHTFLTVDLTSLGIDASQLPSSVDVMGTLDPEFYSEILSEPTISKMGVKYVFEISRREPNGEQRKLLQQHVQVLGKSMSQREGNLEAELLWPKEGYCEALPLSSSMWNACSLPKMLQLNSANSTSLSIEVLRYNPIILRQQSDTATANVTLRFRLKDLNGHGQPAPPKIKLAAQWALQSSTEWNPTISYEQKSLQLNDSGVLKNKTSQLCCPCWKECSTDSDSEGSMWSAEQELPLNESTRHFLPPTFFSDTLQHTYNLKMEISCQSGKGLLGQKTQKIQFNLPIAVIYEAPSYSSDHSPPGYLD